MSFDFLPDEVILKIFSLHPIDQLQTKLRCVSHRWRRLAEDDSHFRKLTIKSVIPSNIAAHWLRKYRQSIKHLNLYERRDINDLAPFIGLCSNLQSLTLTLCHGNGDDLIQAVVRCHRLHTFIMHHCECLRDVSELLSVISNFSMRKINIRNVQTPGNVQFYSLNNVSDFRLKNVAFNFLSVVCFCANNCDSVNTLKLIPSNDDFSTHNSKWPQQFDHMIHDDNAPSSQQCVRWMLKSIGKCVNLRSLCLGPLIARELDDDFLVPISHLSSLTTLVVYQANSVTDVGFTKLFRLPMAQNLTKICLHKCMWVTSNVLRTIACHCLQLEKFTFEKCKHTQTNQDHEDILALVKSCTKLRRLHLFGMDICVAHVLHLLPAYLPNLASLKYSNDSEPMNVPSFLPSLEAKMPNFNVSGLQWKFNLHVNCKRKLLSKTIPSHEPQYVCAMYIKANASYL